MEEDHNKPSHTDKQIIERLEFLGSLIGGESGHIIHQKIQDNGQNLSSFSIQFPSDEKGLDSLQKYLDKFHAGRVINITGFNINDVSEDLKRINDNAYLHIPLKNLDVLLSKDEARIAFHITNTPEQTLNNIDRAIEAIERDSFKRGERISSRNIKPRETLPPEVSHVSDYLVKKIHEVSAMPESAITISHKKVAGGDYAYSVVIDNSKQGRLSKGNLAELIKSINIVLRVEAKPLYDEKETHTGFKFTGKPENLLTYIKYDDKAIYNQISHNRQSSMQIGR